MRAVGLLGGPAGEGIARARVAKAMREKRANLTRENMTRKAKRKERVKAWGVKKTNAGDFIGFFRARLFNSGYLLKNRGATKEG
jgi:hypothetical protein